MTEAQLKKLDKSLNFYQPKSSRYSYNKKSGLYFRINRYVKSEHENPTKSDYMKIIMSYELTQLIQSRYSALTIREKSNRSDKFVHIHPIAFSLGGGMENYAIFNPTENVPHLKAILRDNNNNEINNSALVHDLYDLYCIDKLKVFCITIWFEFFATINGMDLYRMELRDDKGRKIDPSLIIVPKDKKDE